MKKIVSLILSLAMMVSLFACGASKENTSSDVTGQSTASITVTDHNGDKVTLPKKVEKVAVCDIFPLPSVISVFFDSADKLVGIAPTSMSAAKNSLLSELYPEILNAKTDFMNGSDVNTEELAKLEPDVVFFSANNKELGETLRNAGFNAVGISANKWEYNAIETLNQWIKLLSEIFPDNDKYSKVEKYSNEVYDMVQQKTKDLTDEQRERVFFLFQYSDSNIMTSGQKFFGQWWADAIGAVNVANELEKDNSVAVNLEQIYKWNPQTIFITNFNTAKPDDLYNNTVGSYDWSSVKAVADKKVYKMPLGMYRSYTPGVDTPITLLWLAKTTYPELFADIDVTAKTVEYYKNVFGIELTSEQAEKIFTPVSAAGKTYFN